MPTFKQVDVFGRLPYMGNPVAVIFDADALSADQMQRIARWTNLSETVFAVVPTDAAADYRARIFTPGGELPFAGHPTLGTAHAVREANPGLSDKAVLHQECGAGLVRVTTTEADGRRLYALDLPLASIERLSEGDCARLCTALGASVRAGSPAPARVDVGAVWFVIELADAYTVDGLRPDLAALAALSEDRAAAGVTVIGRDPRNPDRPHVRSFAPVAGIDEDPVCGSGNGSVAAWLRHDNPSQLDGTSWTAMQGAQMGRDGEVHVAVGDRGQISIAGGCRTLFDGQVRLDPS